jgi:hypothetical protein
VAPSSEDAILTKASCLWKCNEGFYMDIGSDECRACSVMTSDTCCPGYIYRPCSTFENKDSTCSQQCDAAALGKPGGDSDETGEWVWTTFSEDDGTVLVQNPDGGTDGLPNIRCMWRCRAGYKLHEVDEGILLEGAEGGGGGVGRAKISFCVRG